MRWHSQWYHYALYIYSMSKAVLFIPKLFDVTIILTQKQENLLLDSVTWQQGLYFIHYQISTPQQSTWHIQYGAE